MRKDIAISLAGVLSLTACAEKHQAPAPNIIMLLVDDLGWKDVGFMGSTFYETPNIDKLSHESLIFTNAYAACAVCSPTRASIQTGRYPARTGVTDWIRARFQVPGGVSGSTTCLPGKSGPVVENTFQSILDES